MGWTHLQIEMDRAEDALNGIASDAHRAAFHHLGSETSDEALSSLTEQLGDAVETSESALVGEITAQINRDVNQIITSYRRDALRVSMISQAQGISNTAAAMRVLAAPGQEKPGFVDRAGRRTPSHTHVRRTWRAAMRDTWMTVYLQALSLHGETEAVIWHEDPNHGAQGVIMDLTVPDYGVENLDRIFHPNSGALPMARRQYEEMT